MKKKSPLSEYEQNVRLMVEVVDTIQSICGEKETIVGSADELKNLEQILQNKLPGLENNIGDRKELLELAEKLNLWADETRKKFPKASPEYPGFSKLYYDMRIGIKRLKSKVEQDEHKLAHYSPRDESE